VRRALAETSLPVGYQRHDFDSGIIRDDKFGRKTSSVQRRQDVPGYPHAFFVVGPRCFDIRSHRVIIRSASQP
jgi:hypothetical protein